jgi:hypothetical protein
LIITEKLAMIAAVIGTLAALVSAWALRGRFVDE